jgi:amino acid adenylation domain-containing protein
MSIFSVPLPSHEHLASTSSKHRPRPAYIADLVSPQASSKPEAIAVADKDHELTYGELDTRAKELAQRLRVLGVGPNVVVGLCLPRSVAFVVGALGILKAGGAYLPLDPAYPAARIAFQLNDAQVSVLVTGQLMTEQLPAGSWRVIALDPEGRQTDSESGAAGSESPAIETHGEDLAYVIYTSGSTGQPKGVEITHASLENLVTWHQHAFAVVPSDRAAQLASPGFDAAVWELWPYLTAGAAVYVPDDETVKNPVVLRDWLVRRGITTTFVPTPMAEQLMRLKWPPHTALRALLTGADTLRHYPPATLPFAVVNNYGPTECTVVTTSGTVQPDGRPDRLPSIGRPISNVQVYILDSQLQPVATGEIGQLYIGGDGVGRGYRNHPSLTKERFIPDPFGASGRLYKTGDLGRFTSNGEIDFLGRVDEQIKIRGHRVEPNEIANTLDQNPLVAASAVVARDAVGGEKRVVAYVVPASNVALSPRALQESLRTRLPDYMIPTLFVRIADLPLTSNGKIDRAALPEPMDDNTIHDEGFVAPSTPVQQRLAEIAGQLLKVESVGLHDNFFLMGGHSLLGTQLVTRVNRLFGVELTLREVFESPTIEELAACVERKIVQKIAEMPEEEVQRFVRMDQAS